MASSASAAGSPSSPTSDAAENDLLPFFVLHKASHRSTEGKSVGKVKARRRIDLSPSPTKLPKKLDVGCAEEHNENFCSESRIKAFDTVWSKIELTIKDVLRSMNVKVFDEIHNWVRESFKKIKASGPPGLTEALRPFPVVRDATSRQLFTALVLTKNMEIVDDILTFEELGLHLKSQACHVAKLSSSDFLAKNGVGGCLRSLLRQLVVTTLDVADVSILGSWYRENENYNNPVVVILDDTERCCGSVLSDLILMLSEWAVKIPVILIMGVATTLDAPKKILSTNALQRLCPFKFALSSPSERMDAVIEAALVKQCSGFFISHKVALFMRNYFVCQDGTLSSFVRALKIACLEHFFVEPQSFMFGQFCQEDTIQGLPSYKDRLFSETMIKYASDLPSCKRNKITLSAAEGLAHGLSEMQRVQNLWSIVILCLHEAGKFDNLQLLDLFCEALDPEAYYSRSSKAQSKLDKDSSISPPKGLKQECVGVSRNNFISQMLRKLRDLSSMQLSVLLKRWEDLTVDFIEIHDKVKEIKSSLKLLDGTSVRQGLPNSPKKHVSRSQSKLDKDLRVITDKIVALIQCMLSDHMCPAESTPFHELVCFKNADKLQSALNGDPRQRVQADLQEFHEILCCRCCKGRGNTLLPTVHDTSIMYTLAREHGDLINLHDWYQSFKTIVCPKSCKGKQKTKPSTPKKRKVIDESQGPTEAVIQARFCRAITELQIAGLIRLPTKRRPDFVQRVAFGY